jgi:hypothetical protein
MTTFEFIRGDDARIFLDKKNLYCGNEAPPLPKKNPGRTGKKLATVWSRQKITKEARAGRGLETIWEIAVYMCTQRNTSHGKQP